MPFDYAEGLGFLIHPKNVARYEEGIVSILDRRVYPMKVEFVECKDYREVVQAIRDMVTQSMGPWLASAWGMVLAAHTARNLSAEKASEFMRTAASELGNARPTTSVYQARHMQRILNVANTVIKEGRDIETATLDYVYQILEERYMDDQSIGRLAARLLPDKVRLLTQCFAETFIGYTLLEAR
jgi:methylthioribose-1-phosphate isomerase